GSSHVRVPQNPRTRIGPRATLPPLQINPFTNQPYAPGTFINPLTRMPYSPLASQSNHWNLKPGLPPPANPQAQPQMANAMPPPQSLQPPLGGAPSGAPMSPLNYLMKPMSTGPNQTNHRMGDYDLSIGEPCDPESRPDPKGLQTMIACIQSKMNSITNSL